MKLGAGSFKRFAGALMMALVLSAGAMAGLAASGSPAVAATTNIVVQGNQRIDAETIRSFFRVPPGERLDAARIDDALKGLYATGLYEDVRISQRGNTLTVTVVENPTINRVAFEGNRRVNNDALASEVQSRPRGALSRPTVQADVQRIVEVYRRQGRYNIQVEPKIISLPNNRADLVFEIDEGDRTTVRRIVFVGNNQFSDWRLRDVITTRTTHLFSFLGTADVYDPDRVSADQELLRRFYLKNGYADFRILSATVDLDEQAGGFVITFHFDEGQQYRFGSIDIISNLRDADPEQLRRHLHTRSGSVYNAEQVEKSLEDLTIELARLGYAFAQVRPRGDRDFEQLLINIVFVIEEGPRVYVERIDVRGNTRTRDWVIRREFDILEGDPYNRVMIDRAERRLNNLGYFEQVRITNEPGSAPDRVNVVVTVVEQLTGEFSVGGGYSTSDGLIGEVSLGERNFLGRGQHVRISAQLGQRVRGGEFSFTEPFFMGARVAAGFDIYARQQRRSELNPVRTDTIGGTLRASLPLREELTFGMRYSIFQRDTRPHSGASPAFDEQRGKRLTSLVGYTLTYNTLDNIRNPNQGLHATFSQDFAGLGGDSKFIRTTAEASYYQPLGNDFTGLLKVQGGHVASWGGGRLMVLDHFFHGPNLVRGFAPSGIGPRDIGSSDDDPLGGTLYWGATAELMFPFPFMPKDFGLRAAVFADAGSLWDYRGNPGLPTILWDSNAIRSSVGFSVLWASPFGPLRIDIAHVLTKARHDKMQMINFGIGARF